jgi:hypothetical protein
VNNLSSAIAKDPPTNHRSKPFVHRLVRLHCRLQSDLSVNNNPIRRCISPRGDVGTGISRINSVMMERGLSFVILIYVAPMRAIVAA